MDTAKSEFSEVLLKWAGGLSKGDTENGIAGGRVHRHTTDSQIIVASSRDPKRPIVLNPIQYNKWYKFRIQSLAE